MTILAVALLVSLTTGVGLQIDGSTQTRPRQVTMTDPATGALTIDALDIRGLHAVAVDDVDDTLKIRAGDLLNRDRLDYWSQAIRFHLGDRGYLRANVRYSITASSDTGVRVEIVVAEGVPYVLGQVEIEGCEAISTQEVKNCLGLQPGTLLTASGIYGGIEKVNALYASRGYVHRELNYTPILNDVRVGESVGAADFRVDVDEGRQYLMGEIIFRGMSALDTKALALAISPKADEPFDDEALRQSLIQIANAYDADDSYYPDYRVDFDDNTGRAIVEVFGFTRKQSQNP